MSRKKRKVYSQQFKEDAVQLVKKLEKSIAQIARDLGIGEQCLRNWVKQAEMNAGDSSPDAQKAILKEELARVRKELKEVTMERDFLKKVAAFFAQETTNTK